MDDVAVLAIWNATALIALGVSLVALGGALADWEYLKERRMNGLRSIQAFANVRNHTKRSLVALLFLVIGALALVEVPYRGAISRWLLIAASLILMLASIWDWIDRARMVRLLIRSEERPEPVP